ncbi:hypothetical protein RG47T_1406 [Mucilaginibacter polytrichastri]|uniref:Uncharacterized protein n=1 Tax=Mucilaginibacter polytrichastri TaxID=1302689 RepID=A0A1Q5ZW21_9SPHI|nr:hypothetical protein RG47T_1406 [Mucilaginibacter polytrichastri]
MCCSFFMLSFKKQPVTECIETVRTLLHNRTLINILFVLYI